MSTHTSLQTLFTTAGCSAEPNVLDIGPDGLLAYASGPNLLLYFSDTSMLLDSGSAVAPIHAVRILSVNNRSKYIVAANGEGRIFWWSAHGSPLGAVTIANASINYLTHLFVGEQDEEFLLCFSDTLGRIYVSKLSELTMSLEPQLSVDNGQGRKVISLALQRIGTNTVIYAGLSDNRLVVIHQSKMCLSLPGHTNWINSIDALVIDQDLFILTGSSDRTIRVWRVSEGPCQGPSASALLELVPSRNDFYVDGRSYSVTCESIIYGHEGMIRSVRWAAGPAESPAGKMMISASADGTIILWRETLSMGWVTEARVGNIAGINTSGGFFSGIFSHDGNGKRRIIGHVASGSIMEWLRDDSTLIFLPRPPLETGHFLEVKSCDWSRCGHYVITAGLDRTTRIWGSSVGGKWREIARPQIHGYELVMVRSLPDGRFLSAGDEKILRAFVAPKSFWRRAALFLGTEVTGPSEEETGDQIVSIPALGLSNKISNDEHETRQRIIPLESSLSQAPTEPDLIQHTLWLETDKLYGHGLELYALAVSNSGRLAASASKATTPEDAGIRLWSRQDDDTWRLLPRTINAHSLTVVSIAFCPQDKLLLAVSRDRHWSLTRIEDPMDPKIEIVHEAHTRIIWCAAWGLCGQTFFTGSRDRTLKTWEQSKDGTWGERVAARMTLEHAVTALAMHSVLGLLAVGLEDGTMSVYATKNDRIPQLAHRIKAHSSTINDIRWHPTDPIVASVSTTLQIHSMMIRAMLA